MTCRYCKGERQSQMLRYGPRHYAHVACLKNALTPDAFEALLKKIARHQLLNIPYFEAQELGILPLLKRLAGMETK